MRDQTKRGSACAACKARVVRAALAAVIALVTLAAGLTTLGTARPALAQTARISSIIPADRVIYPGEEVKVRVIFMFDRPPRLENPEVRYRIFEIGSDVAVATGSVPFNQTMSVGGWAELRPELPRDSKARWYRTELSFWDGAGPIPIAGAGNGGELARMTAHIGFGVLPEQADYSKWPAHAVEPAVPSRKVMAFYYPWYGNPLVSNRWVHWPEGGHNPDAFDANGLPDLGAADHPVLGPYDSHDPRVIKQHLEWAEAAGIDVLIASWWGQGEFSDQALGRLLDAAAKTRVRISLYYEAIPGSTEDGALRDLRYLLSQYGEHPGIFKHDGEPVIFVYARALNQIPYAGWQRVLETIKEEYRVKLIADSADGRWAELFDGLHMYNLVGPVVGGSDMRRVYESLVWAAKSRGKISSVTVIPGYDDSNIGRTSVIVAPRRDGALYDELWELAIESRPDWVLITSFNEWHEGSEIEPSVEYGDQYLRSTASWAARYKAAPERTLWVEKSSMPVVAVPGGKYPVSISVVRTGGSDDGRLLVQWEFPDGWAVTFPQMDEGGEVERDGGTSSERGDPVGGAGGGEKSRVKITALLVVPGDAEPGEYAQQVTLSWKGYDLKLPGSISVVDPSAAPFDGAGVWVELGEENRTFGLVQRDLPDGATAPMVVDGVEARTTAPGETPSKYIYFDVADGFFYDSSGTAVEIGIEYFDDRVGTFRLHYDSTNPWGGPFDGAYTDGPAITMRGTGTWQVALVRVPDARFANRQNGGTDFRLAVGTNDLVVRRVWVRVLDETVR